MTMIDKPQGGTWSRRSIVGAGIGAALLFDRRGAATARQTPSASSVLAGDRAAWLIDRDALNAIREQTDLVVVALMPNDVFAKGHIPGAVAVDWPALELGTTTDAAITAWAAAMREVMTSLGIGAASDVVIYDEGTLFSARLWWILDYLGHDAKRMLDGGLPAWKQRELPVTAGSAAAPENVNRPLSASRVRSAALAPLAEVEASLGARDVVFVDARTPDEYAAGHIPGAVNVNYPLNAQPESPPFWKSNDALRALYASVGVTPDKRVIPYCTTGVRSAVTWCALQMIGFPNAALFTGSWAEWSTHPELPVTTGSQP